MKVKMYIPSVDDSNNRYSTSFLFRSTVKIYKYANNLNRFGEYEIQVNRIFGRKDTLDPTYDSIESALKSHLFPTHLQLSSKMDNLTCIITFKYKDGNSTIVFQKSKPHFFLNGSRQNKSIVIGNVARIIYRSCFECSSRTMDKYISRLLLFPPNVTYAIENRTEFNYYVENGVPVKVRINTRPISDFKCALEISDGIWGEISIPDLNAFINFHRFSHRRSQKWGISPKFLWANLMGKLPTSGQEKLMLEFLQQNRTQDIVEQRAEQLLNELEIEYPLRLKQFEYNFNEVAAEDTKSLFVRGKLCDWILMDNYDKSAIQKVNTYLYLNDGGSDSPYRKSMPYKNGYLIGPICIDNIHRNSSRGDQFAARAMALLNDENTIKLVSTIKEYIPTNVLLGKIEHRVGDINEV